MVYTPHMKTNDYNLKGASIRIETHKCAQLSNNFVVKECSMFKQLVLNPVKYLLIKRFS